MTTQTMDTKTSKASPTALKLLLIAGLSVQAWGVLMGLSLIVLNVVR